MRTRVRVAASSALSLLGFLLALLGAVSLGLAAWQWGEIVSSDVTLAEMVAIHGRFSRTLIQLFLILGGCLLLLGGTGVVAGVLLLIHRLRKTTGTFVGVFLLVSFLMATTYILMTSLFWWDSTRVGPLVLSELATRVKGQAYLQNSFQFRTYWDGWQTTHRCCGVYNATDFSNSATANNASDPLNWLPNSCCNQSLALINCHRATSAVHAASCQGSVTADVSLLYWPQLGVSIAIWATFFALVPVSMAVFVTCCDPRTEEEVYY